MSYNQEDYNKLMVNNNSFMSFEEKITLSPVKKYKKYNKFPWKMTLNFILLVLTTYQAIAIVEVKQTHIRDMKQVFRFIFLGISYQANLNVNDYSTSIPILSAQDLQLNLQWIPQQIQYLSNSTLGIIDTDQVTAYLELYYNQYNFKQNQLQSTKYSLNLNEGITTPFNVSNITEMRTYLQNVNAFNIKAFNIKGYWMNGGANINESTCLNWTLTFLYQFASRSLVNLELQSDYKLCNNQTFLQRWTNFEFVNIIVFLFSSISFILSCKSIYSLGYEYEKQRLNYFQVKQVVKQQITPQIKYEKKSTMKSRTMSDPLDDDNLNLLQIQHAKKSSYTFESQVSSFSANKQSFLDIVQLSPNSQMQYKIPVRYITQDIQQQDKKSVLLQSIKENEYEDTPTRNKKQHIELKKLKSNNQNGSFVLDPDNQISSNKKGYSFEEYDILDDDNEDQEIYRYSLRDQDYKDLDDPIKERLLKFEKSWNEIGFFNKLKLFNKWIFANIIGNLFQMIGSIAAIFESIFDRSNLIYEAKETFVGFGAMFAWLMIISYLDYYKDYNAMSYTLKHSAKNVCTFCLGIIPFFLGFVFLAYSIMHEFQGFSNLTYSGLTLFAISQGDDVSATFAETFSAGNSSRLFFVIYIILFFVAIQNALVIFVLNAFSQIQRKNKEKENKIIQQKKEIEQKFKDLAIREMSNDEISNILKSNKLNSIKEDSNNMNSDKKYLILSKIQLTIQRIDRNFEGNEEIFQEILDSDLSDQDKQYLLIMYRDNFVNLKKLVVMQKKYMKEKLGK